jgi:subtilase family serine protease
MRTDTAHNWTEIVGAGQSSGFQVQPGTGATVKIADVVPDPHKAYCYVAVAYNSYGWTDSSGGGGWAGTTDSPADCGGPWTTPEATGTGNGNNTGNNGNNAGKPDLVVGTPWVDGDGTDGAFPKAGEPFTVHFQVCNAGTADSVAYTDGYQLEDSVDGVLATGTKPATALKTGACHTDEISFTSGLDDLPPAEQYYLSLTADVNNNVAESNENNNQNYESIWVDGP